jgi:hypothetical protein
MYITPKKTSETSIPSTENVWSCCQGILCCTPCCQHCQGHVPSAERCWANPPYSPELSLCQLHVFTALKKQLQNSQTKMSRLWQYSVSSKRPEKKFGNKFIQNYIKCSVLYTYHEGIWGTWGVASLFLINLNNRWKWSTSHPSHLISREKARSTHSVGGCVSSRSDLNALQRKISLVSA